MSLLHTREAFQIPPIFVPRSLPPGERTNAGRVTRAVALRKAGVTARRGFGGSGLASERRGLDPEEGSEARGAHNRDSTQGFPRGPEHHRRALFRKDSLGGRESTPSGARPLLPCPELGGGLVSAQVRSTGPQTPPLVAPPSLPRPCGHRPPPSSCGSGRAGPGARRVYICAHAGRRPCEHRARCV